MTRFSVSVYMHSEIKHQFFIKNLISNWFPPKIHDFLRKHITERKRKMSKNWISSENSYTIYYLCRINKSKILKNWIDLSYCSRKTGEIFFLQIFLCRKLGFGSWFNFFREKVKFYLVRKNSFLLVCWYIIVHISVVDDAFWFFFLRRMIISVFFFIPYVVKTQKRFFVEFSD